MKPELDINEILNYLPHRYPFLLVDRVLEYKKGETLLGLKNVTHNEPFFPGHFPGKPVMPGVIMIEALAQAAGILIFLTTDTKPHKENMFYFAGIDNVRFKRIVEPGDQLLLHIELDRNKRDLWKFITRATVNGEIACTANIMIAR